MKAQDIAAVDGRARPLALRDEAADALRAIAIFGVGLINILVFAYPDFLSDGFIVRNFDDPVNRIAVMALTGFVLGKFIVIFTALFGWSAHMQLSSGAAGRQAFRGRLAGLFLLGAAHLVFIFMGDILLTYSIVGVALVRSAGWSSRRLRRSIIRWAIAASIFLALMIAILGIAALVSTSKPTDNSDLARVFQSGGLVAVFAARWASQGYYVVFGVALAVLCAVPIARLGFLLGRMQATLGAAIVVEVLVRWSKKIFWPAVLINLSAALGLAAANGDEARLVCEILAANVGGPLLAVVYASAALRILINHRDAAVVKMLAAAGRSSLSIYILQSVLAGFVFYGYGLGWHGRLGPAAVASLSILLTLSLAASMLLWSRFYGRGPFERLVRLEGLRMRSPS